MQQTIFIVDLIACSTCFGHHYSHHQELENIIQVAAACGIVEIKCQLDATYDLQHQNTTGSSHLYNILELLMMGIMVPETC
jgi:hypothetical protein